MRKACLRPCWTRGLSELIFRVEDTEDSLMAAESRAERGLRMKKDIVPLTAQDRHYLHAVVKKGKAAALGVYLHVYTWQLAEHGRE
jgi:hypothetical protein